MHNDTRTYIDYFRSHIKAIDSISDRLHRKLLYTAIIDTLSRAAFGDIRKHRKRVVTFLDVCSGWCDKDRISSFQLKLALELHGKTKGSLFADVKRRVDSWNIGNVIRPENDPMIDQLRCVSGADEYLILEKARYANLYYEYRNHLVHEFREKGHGMEISDDLSTPYYLSMEGSPWELTFPAPFLKDICCQCINGLDGFLFENALNPYDAYDFGVLWIK